MRFKDFINEKVSFDLKKILSDDYDLKDDLDQEDIDDGEYYIDDEKLTKFFDKAFKKYSITPTNDEDFIECVVDLVDEIDSKNEKEWKKYKESEFLHTFEYSDLYDEYFTGDDWEESKITDLMQDMIKNKEYRKPSKAIIKKMIKSIKDYDNDYSDEEKVKIAADEFGLKITGGKVVSKVIKIVASDKYSLPSAVSTAKKIAKDFKDIKITKASDGVKVTGPEESVNMFIKTKGDEITY
jgi:hypothetical protein